MIRLCVAGATGRMGQILIKEALVKGFNVCGAVAVDNVNKTLREVGICDSTVKIMDPSDLKKAVSKADVYITFTSPAAELINIPRVAAFRKKIVMGTTGFSQEQMNQVERAVASQVPAVFAPNFSIGIHMLYQIIKTLKLLPKDYDISIIETHHAGKKDAPSGTALAISKLISDIRGYKVNVFGRSGVSPRKAREIEVLAVRGGGIPGIHRIMVAGPSDMLVIEHQAFSRRVFAQGALHAAQWLVKQTEPGVYSLNDVFSS